jgi:very-short-patch-repair endonuclease
MLVLKGKALRFLPKVESALSGEKTPLFSHPNITVTEDIIKENTEILPSDFKNGNELPERHKSLTLQTDFDRESLQKRLFATYHESTSVLEEQGYTILYLALGFLEWYESPASQKPNKAPLILIPIDMKRDNDRTSYRIEWTNEDIISNISLKEKLKEQGIILPDFDMPEDKGAIDEYFRATLDAIKKFPNWHVLSDIHLDFFSFTKFIMFKDLDAASWPEGMGPATHPLLNLIFSPSMDLSQGVGFSEDEVDQKLSAHDLYHIMDADSSQIAVIEDIKATKNLVVEGPPGTGKSQTIANAIAELLAQEKSVLFISEKMAALEVVKKRLDVAGLGDYCLALHSRKSNKREVLQELQRTLNLPAPRQILLDEDITQLEKTKAELNDYTRALELPIGNRKISPYNLFGTSETVRKHFARVNRQMPRINFPSPEDCTEQEWAEATGLLTNIAELLPRVRPVNQNPWYGTSPGLVLPAHVDQIRKMIESSRKSLLDLKEKIAVLTNAGGIASPKSIKELEDAIGATKLIASSNPVDRDLLINKAWDHPHPAVAPLTTKIRDFSARRKVVLGKFKDRILNEDVESILNEFQPLSNRFFLLKLIDSKYRSMRQVILLLYKSEENLSDESIVRDLSNVIECFKIRKSILYDGVLGKSLFGSLWKDEESDPEQLERFSRWIVEFRHQMILEVFTDRTVDMLSRGVAQDLIEQSASEAQASLEKFRLSCDELFERLSFDIQKNTGKNPEFVTFDDYDHWINAWNLAVPSLVDWSHYNNGLIRLNESIGRSMVPEIEIRNLAAEDILPTFTGNYVDSLLEQAFIERPALANFIGDSHEKRIERFIELDKKIILGNRLRLMWKLWQSMPKMKDGASRDSEMGILLAEFIKKKRHMPIRVLMKNAGGLIQNIKPCFMMSPLSVAQFLDPQTVKFDAIIFDEASQVRPEDALGSLMRGNQAVVIGDSRQLPPTSFFDKVVEADPDSVDETVTMSSDIESILNLCKMGFPTKVLRWHYRSRHESLIALSNSRFYDNALFVYPSPMRDTPELGLKFVHLPQHTYDRGGSSINRGEAREVAKAVIEHFMRFPEKSLGVGAFNIKQQLAIQEEIEVLLQQNPDIQHLFKNEKGEDFFVKNLETIQGDERDVIFLSIGFGKDAFGKLNQNFGPLNQDGGERRLNVLITRARERCVVFSNFTSRDLTITESSPIGLKTLKLFLEYAETGVPPVVMTPGGEVESPFEESVYEVLRDHGHQLQKQVGCAGFRIDLAIIDPSEPGKYLIGIECDGAQYHSSKVARDRDRLRQQILEGLGWQIYRVWSTDWYRSPEFAKKSLLEAIENVKLNQVNQSERNPPKIEVFKEIPPEEHEQLETTNQNHTDIGIESDIPVYRQCTQLSRGVPEDVTSVNLYYIADAIVEIVNIESPVHVDDVIDRIQALSGIRRMGPKMRGHLYSAIGYAIDRNAVKKIGDFLWRPETPDNYLRRRLPNQKPDIDRICDPEIGLAIFFVLNNQFATSKDDIAGPVARCLGLKATKKIVERIPHVIDEMIKFNVLEILPNQKISLKKK